VFGNQLGVALGFVLPAAVVKDQENKEDYHLIGNHIFYKETKCPLFIN